MIQPDLFAISAAPAVIPVTVGAVIGAGFDTDRFAADYSRSIRAALTAAELDTVRRRDAAETDAGIEHAQDFIDTADAMNFALMLQGLNLRDAPLEAAHGARKARAAGYSLIRVLIGCEFSGTVSGAFRALGHDAVSADLLPTEGTRPDKHYLGDVREIMADGYDMAIYHPPCRYLAASGLHWNKRRPGRAAKTAAALDFVRDLMTGPRWILENSKGCIPTRITPPLWDGVQMIQPNQFGHDASKQTYLFRKGLPPLVADPADQIAPRMVRQKNGSILPRWANQTDSGQNVLGPSADRWKIRATTYAGIGRALAVQMSAAAAA